MTSNGEDRRDPHEDNVELEPYPVGPVEDAVREALFEEGEWEPPYRVVGLHKELPLDPIPILRRFHRAPEGHIALMKLSRTKGLKRLASPTPTQLEDVASKLGSQLDDDVYFSINAFFRENTHRTADLARLNALYVDIDFHDAATSAPRPDRMNRQDAEAELSRLPYKALRAVWEAQDELLIPPPSLLALSGRGIWLFFLLVDPNDGLPPKAYPEKVSLYIDINRELHQRLMESSPLLAGDPNAADASRITRLPGSRHASANRQVKYVVQADHRGRGLVYGLDEFADLIGLQRATRAGPPRRTGERVPARYAGWAARWSYLLDDLTTLERLRGGFREGDRNNALWMTAYAMRKLGFELEEIEEAVLRRAASSRPPYSPAQAMRSARSAIEGTRAVASNMRIKVGMSRLRVTGEEEHSMKTLRSPEHRLAHRAPSRKEIADERRAFLAKLMAADEAAGRRQRSVRDLVFALNEAGIKATRSTVDRDLKAFGSKGSKPRVERPSS